jgi:hypothetical protein
MLTWARLLCVPQRRVNPSRTGDPHPWNAPFLINRREERCEDRLADFLRRLSLDLVGIARAAKGDVDRSGFNVSLLSAHRRSVSSRILQSRSGKKAQTYRARARTN